MDIEVIQIHSTIKFPYRLIFTLFGIFERRHKPLHLICRTGRELNKNC